MAFVVWKEEYSVKISQFDNQHKVLFRIVDDLYVAMQEGKGNEVLKNILDKLEEYTLVHFREEELYLERSTYPGLPEQIAEHKKFIDVIGGYKSDLENQKMGLSLKVVNFLESWLSHHIKTKDKEYALFLGGQ